MTRVKLICHAATEAIRSTAFPADEPVDRAALDRLAGTAFHLGHADRCWTSPAARARQTAEALGLAPDEAPALRECDYGRWSGCAFEDVRTSEPEALDVWLGDPSSAPHGGEALLALLGRVADWLDAQQEQPGRVLAVTHASVIRAALIHAIGAPPASFWRIDVPPLSMARLSGRGGYWTLGGIGPLQGGRSGGRAPDA